jgi:inosine-uridine nucleoside N-ribohydrolase
MKKGLVIINYDLKDLQNEGLTNAMKEEEEYEERHREKGMKTNQNPLITTKSNAAEAKKKAIEFIVRKILSKPTE